MSGYNQGPGGPGGHESGAFGNRDSGYGSHGSGNSANNPQSTTAKPHKSSLLNKLDPRVKSDTRDTQGTEHGNRTTDTGHSGYYNSQDQYDNPRTTTGGPHNSSVANKADPRVHEGDRHHPTTSGGGYGTAHSTGPRSNISGSSGSPPNEHTRSTGTYELPSSANRDPRVESQYGAGTHSGYGGQGGHPQPTRQSPPHNSHLANKADPRYDAGRDNRAGYGAGPGTTGQHGYPAGQHGHPAGQHGYNTGNQGNTGGFTNPNNPSYNNPNSSNVGPHSSNVANKLDPRVDANPSGAGNTTGQGFGASHNAGEATTISSSAEGRGNGGLTGSHKGRLTKALNPNASGADAGVGNGPAQATANASITGAGPSGAPEGQSSASGPTSASANTTTTSNPISKVADKLSEPFRGDHQGTGNNLNSGQTLGDREAVEDATARRRHY